MTPALITHPFFTGSASAAARKVKQRDAAPRPARIKLIPQMQTPVHLSNGGYSK